MQLRFDTRLDHRHVPRQRHAGSAERRACRESRRAVWRAVAEGMPPAQHAPQAGGLTQGGRGAQTQRAEGVVEAAADALQRRCAATLAEILRVEIDVRQAGEGFEREGAQLQLLANLAKDLRGAGIVLRLQAVGEAGEGRAAPRIERGPAVARAQAQAGRPPLVSTVDADVVTVVLGRCVQRADVEVGLAVAEQSARAPPPSERRVGTGEEAGDVTVQA